VTTVATYLDNLIARRNAISAELAALGVSKAGGLPNTTGAGSGTDHVGYKDGLIRELKEVNELIKDAMSNGGGTGDPWEVTTVGF
jgi:hypothetical protein